MIGLDVGFRSKNARMKVLILKNILFLSTYTLMSDRIGGFVAMPSENTDVAEIVTSMVAIDHLPGMTTGPVS